VRKIKAKCGVHLVSVTTTESITKEDSITFKTGKDFAWI